MGLRIVRIGSSSWLRGPSFKVARHAKRFLFLFLLLFIFSTALLLIDHPSLRPSSASAASSHRSSNMFKDIVPAGLLSLLAASGHASATLLYAASYSGTVTTLSLTRDSNATRAGTLEVIATTDGCAGSPSWLTLDAASSTLYCTDEGFNIWPEGSVASFKTNADGSLSLLDRVRTPFGPVSAVVYGQDSKGLAVAHYGGSAFTTWNINNPAAMGSVQSENYTMSAPGPDPSRQEAPHPHEAALDPSGRFVLLPDLGADLIRIYAVGSSSDLVLEERKAFTVKPGSGPRHVAFAVKGEKTLMYLVSELANTITGYEVHYGYGSIDFKEIWCSSTHGVGKHVPKGTAAAEIVVSPDTNFLIVSSRNESSHHIPNFDPTNSTDIISDPLFNFAIDAETGGLDLIQEVPCGGRFPRHFSMNKDGTLIATAMQTDGTVAVIQRDPTTGKLGDFVAFAQLAGQVTAVIFNEAL